MEDGKKPAEVNAYEPIDAVNDRYEQFYRMNQFTKHQLYEIYKIEPTSHDSFGKGYRAFVLDPENNAYKVQLPGKYLRTLKIPDHIDEYIADITEGVYPYLVFHNQLQDGSCHIQILKGSEENREKFISKMIVLPPPPKRRPQNTSSPSPCKLPRKSSGGSFDSPTTSFEEDRNPEDETTKPGLKKGTVDEKKPSAEETS